jgi:hypothetical protein
MINLFKRYLFAWRFKRAVKQANDAAALTGLRYYVIYINGKLRVVPKQNIKALIHRHRFRKGTTVDDIERRALYSTKMGGRHVSN